MISPLKSPTDMLKNKRANVNNTSTDIYDNLEVQIMKRKEGSRRIAESLRNLKEKEIRDRDEFRSETEMVISQETGDQDKG